MQGLALKSKIVGTGNGIEVGTWSAKVASTF